MDINTFKELLEGRSIKLSSEGPMDLSWTEYKKFATITSKVNFGCAFKYASEGDDFPSCVGSSKYGCCTGCRYNIGYFDVLPNDDKILTIIASYFNKQGGFHKLGKGCMLPRKYRSIICLTHSCSMAVSNRNEWLSAKDKNQYRLNPKNTDLFIYTTLRYISSILLTKAIIPKWHNKIKHAILSII